ncbi:MAG: DUF4956 domain-containing protein [Bacteroidales bacterium]|nr:DUF4956 domain-containing protein [Bacteroidales bacterium]
MNEFINKLIFNGPDLIDVIFSLSLATILGMLISQLYKGTHRGLNYEHTFIISLVLMAPVVTTVMLYIRGDLVLSLGLIGSLSIVRFRTAIKDTRDMIFIFWVIAIGLGAGTFNWSIVLVSSLFIIVVVAVLYYFRYGHSQNKDFILSFSGQLPHAADEVREIFLRYTVDARMRSYEVTGENWEIIYELRLSELSSSAANDLIRALKTLPGVHNVSLLAPQLSLPL